MSIYFVPNGFHFNYSIISKEIVICQALSGLGIDIINFVTRDELDNIIKNLSELYKQKNYYYKFSYMNVFEFQIVGQPQFESVLLEINKRIKLEKDIFDDVTILLG